MAIVRTWLLLATAALAGCFDAPRAADCALSCERSCPEGYHCVDGRCRPAGVERVCPGAAADGAPPATDGAPPAGLVDEGLLVRYYLDEAESGTGPSELLDHGPLLAAIGPLDLPIAYADSFFTADDRGNRGLHFPAALGDGRAAAFIDGTKLWPLDGARRATIEVVVDVDGLAYGESRLSHVGKLDTPGYFTLHASTQGDRAEVRFVWYETIVAATWPLDLPARGRTVLHMVLDTERGEGQRARLYADGELVPASAQDIPAGARIEFPDLETDQVHFALGNRHNGAESDRSFAGTLFYAALYDEALDIEQVRQNGDHLRVDDDAP